MKREDPTTKPEYYIKKIKTFFKWNKCDICGFEFRRELMWGFTIMCGLNWGRDYIICTNCCRTIDAVDKHRTKLINYRPPAPPITPSGNVEPSKPWPRC